MSAEEQWDDYPRGRGPHGWMTVAEAAIYLGVTDRWMRRQIAHEHIKYSKLGGLIRFKKSDLDELIDKSLIPDRKGPPKPRGGQEQITRKRNLVS